MNDERDLFPMRTFDVTLSYPMERLSNLHETVKAHIPQEQPTGSLQFLVYRGGVSWTIRHFAAGTWKDYTASVPSETELAAREQALYRIEETNKFLREAKSDGATRQ